MEAAPVLALITPKPTIQAPGRCQGTRNRKNSNSTQKPREENHRKQGGIWGHHMGEKKDGYIRILFQNIGGLRQKGKGTTYKLDKFKRTVLKNEVDIYGMAEVNTDWRLMETEQTLWTRTKGWHKHRRISISHNTQGAPKLKFQVGGTATIIANEVACRVTSVNQDHQGFGRWSSTLIQGKGNLHRSAQ